MRRTPRRSITARTHCREWARSLAAIAALFVVTGLCMLVAGVVAGAHGATGAALWFYVYAAGIAAVPALPVGVAAAACAYAGRRRA